MNDPLLMKYLESKNITGTFDYNNKTWYYKAYKDIFLLTNKIEVDLYLIVPVKFWFFKWSYKKYIGTRTVYGNNTPKNVIDNIESVCLTEAVKYEKDSNAMAELEDIIQKRTKHD